MESEKCEKPQTREGNAHARLATGFCPRRIGLVEFLSASSRRHFSRCGNSMRSRKPDGGPLGVGRREGWRVAPLPGPDSAWPIISRLTPHRHVVRVVAPEPACDLAGRVAQAQQPHDLRADRAAFGELTRPGPARPRPDVRREDLVAARRARHVPPRRRAAVPENRRGQRAISLLSGLAASLALGLCQQRTAGRARGSNGGCLRWRLGSRRTMRFPASAPTAPYRGNSASGGNFARLVRVFFPRDAKFPRSSGPPGPAERPLRGASCCYLLVGGQCDQVPAPGGGTGCACGASCCYPGRSSSRDPAGWRGVAERRL